MELITLYQTELRVLVALLAAMTTFTMAAVYLSYRAKKQWVNYWLAVSNDRAKRARSIPSGVEGYAEFFFEFLSAMHLLDKAVQVMQSDTLFAYRLARGVRQRCRFEATCELCGRPIEAGQRIALPPFRAHAGCARRAVFAKGGERGA